MPEAPVDPDQWLNELPLRFGALVVRPVCFRTFTDDMAHARKIVGLDAQGRRCYVRHLHTVVEERFDIDEFPLEVASCHERRIAWRLQTGSWLMQVDRVERLDSCCPQVIHTTPVLLSESELGF